MMRTQTNTRADRVTQGAWWAGAAAAAALLGGCTHARPAASVSAPSPLQPGSTIAVSDALGARVFASSPKAVAARKAAAQNLAAAHD